VNILIGCEESGIVRDEFRKRGHNAISCDLLPSRKSGPHIQDNIFNVVYKGYDNRPWDIGIFFYPCTYLAVSGARWHYERQAEQFKAIQESRELMDCLDRTSFENPIGVLSTRIRKPDQIIQPWMFGHGETKATCLWLKGLPLLEPTQIVSGREPRIHRMPPSPDRPRLRSETYPGVGRAMAEQWGRNGNNLYL
jgi:hypothetical protein